MISKLATDRSRSTGRGKLLFMAASAMAAWAAIQPVSAQTSGVGADGATRLLWRGTDNRASVYKLDGNLNFVTYQEFGPIYEWLPVAITTTSTNSTYLLWRHTAGSVAIWRLNADLDHVGDIDINNGAALAGWTPVGLSWDPNPASSYMLRLIWRHTSGEVGVWKISELNFTPPVEVGYGPFFGWDPGPP
jgi:hypothetical protein